MMSELPQLSDDALESLRPDCDQFYGGGSIGAFFYTRFAVLAALNEHREQFVAWAGEGLSFHGTKIAIPSVETDGDPSDPPSANSDPLQWYIQTETISLQHHALETLLRLYTGLIEAGHWLDPLKAVADRDRNLPRLVEQHITGKHEHAMRDDVRCLLFGDPEVLDDAAGRLADIDTLSGILRTIARQWLDGRRPYNAVKHGLLISQGNRSLSTGLTGEPMRIVGAGPSVTCLNHTAWTSSEHTPGGKARRWSVDTHWINFEQASRLIVVACVLIDCLWSIAVARWSQAGGDEVRVPVIDNDIFNLSGLSEAGPSVEKMSWSLFSEIKPG